MSRENVEILAEAFRFFDGADWESYRGYWTEHAVAWPPDGWPEPGPFRGRTDIVNEWRRVREDWSLSHVSVEEAHTGEGDRFVFRLNWGAEGAESHLPVTMEVFGACRFEGGRIAEMRFFWEYAEALEAAGLSE